MENKSYWIWHWGEYEIYHAMAVNLRRETRGAHVPPFWRVATPYVSVKFKKELSCEGGYLLCYANGEGNVTVDGRMYRLGARIELARGRHIIEVKVSNREGFPAIFVQSDVCPSDGSWLSNSHAGFYDEDFQPVGYRPCFDCAEKNPVIFPFSYEKRLPVSEENVNGGILYDFGTELFGYLNIGGAAVGDAYDIFYGESREEALDTEYSYLTDSVSGHSAYRLRQRAFRYVFVKNAQGALDVSADHEYLPFEREGTFECDDALFNDILKACARTFRLNCREAFFDGVKRDRWVWGGDAYQSARINRYLFADKDIEERTLVGLIGKDEVVQHINLILDYSLFWIIELYEYYSAYGDREFLTRIYPMARKMIAFCERRLNADGFLEGRAEDWIFIDWSDVQKTGAVSAIQMLLVRAYEVMASLSFALALPESEDFKKKSELLKKRVNEYYWNEELGAYIESYQTERVSVTRHANVFAVMYDIASEAQKQAILSRVFKNDQVPQITTPYFKGYELDALARLGELGAVESEIASYWGGMIRLGAQTVWEEYDPRKEGVEHYAMYGGRYEKSLCHAWGASPIYLFGRYYLGVYETSAGAASFAVQPNRGGFKRISGSVPLKDGYVKVTLDEKTLSVTATVSGGELLWQGEEYPLNAHETLTLAI